MEITTNQLIGLVCICVEGMRPLEETMNDMNDINNMKDMNDMNDCKVLQHDILRHKNSK